MTKQSNNSSAAAAAAAAAVASTNAQQAAKTASESANVIAVVANDVSWMKKSLIGIETKLNEMDKAFVTAAQHADVIKSIDNHEGRINTLETEKTRVTVLLSIAIGIGIFMATLMVYHIAGR
jgi:hypothetical protein